MARLAPKLLALLVSLLLPALAAELWLRWRVGPPVHFVYPQPRYVTHPEVGHWLAPGQRAFNHDAPLRVNSVGIRGGEHPRAIPEGKRRILALGDSQTFGNGLALEDTWPLRLEGELNARTREPRWEVLNAGLPATETWQHARMIELLARHYRFDAVVLGFYVNDVTTEYAPASVRERTNTWTKRIGYVLKRSALATALWQTAQRLLLDDGVAERERRILTGEAHPETEKAWAEVERSLVEIQLTARAQDAPLLLLVLPRRDQVRGESPPTGYNERIAEIAARHAIPVVDVLGPLRRAHERHGRGLFIPWDGHNSARANEIIARELAGPLLEQQDGGRAQADPAPPRGGRGDGASLR